MKTIFIIDDDLVTTKIYQDMLEAEGFFIEVFGDGQQGIDRLRQTRPDLVLLDLMLPKVSGIEVLKFIRAQPETANVAVIVFTNAYLQSMVKAAWNAGANMTVTKANCPPEKLVQAVRTALAVAPETSGTFADSRLPDARQKSASSPPPIPTSARSSFSPAGEKPIPMSDAAKLHAHPGGPPPTRLAPEAARLPTVASASATPSPSPTQIAPPARLARTPSARPAVVPSLAPAPPSPGDATSAQDPHTLQTAIVSGMTASQSLHGEIRQKFLSDAPRIAQSLQKWLADWAPNVNKSDWATPLHDVHILVRPLPGHAGIAKFDTIAQLASALEALLEALFEDPARINASSFRTVTQAIEVLLLFFQHPVDSQNQTSGQATLLVVDDEAISRQVIRSALELANLKSISIDDPTLALRMLEENPFDLVFADVAMPQMNGFDLCAKIRAMPSHKETPVVFVTVLADYDSRARSTISGGNDLIAKPFLLIELAVKALTYVFSNQVQIMQKRHDRS